MRWAEKQRIGHIGERLMAGQAVRRADLMEKFGISLQQASSDIRKFNSAHPGAMRYDRTKRMYVAGCINAPGRDTTAAADILMRCTEDYLQSVAARDPGMIRDVAAALIYERSR